MNLKEIKELVRFLKEEEITEFELERGDVKVRIKRGSGTFENTPSERIIAVHPAISTPISQSVPVSTSAPPIQEPARNEAQEELHIVKSPIVGTYYESPSPGSPPFVKPGDFVEAGQVLCIVE